MLSSVTPAPCHRVHLLLDVGADDIARAAVTVDVVDAVLRVVFLDEDRRELQIGLWLMVSTKRPRARSLSASMACAVGGPPVWSELIHMNSNWGTVPCCTSFWKVLIPDIEAELVGDAQIELRVVLDRVLDQVRERGVRADRVVVVELLARVPGLVGLCVVVELDPGRRRSYALGIAVELCQLGYSFLVYSVAVQPGTLNVLYSMYSP